MKMMSGARRCAMAAMRRAKRTPLMLPRCRSLKTSAVRPRQEAGRIGQLDRDATNANHSGRSRFRRGWSRIAAVNKRVQYVGPGVEVSGAGQETKAKREIR